MLKTIIKITLTTIAAIIIMVATIIFTTVSSGVPADGTYKITDFDEYPDAYVKVKDGVFQFYNIDLNAIYQEEQLRVYNRLIEIGPQYVLTDDELAQCSDLNNLMVENPYYYDYEFYKDGAKTGTFEYTYFCYPGRSYFGLIIVYNSFHRTLHINNETQELTFKK